MQTNSVADIFDVGKTGDFALTVAGNIDECGIHIWRLVEALYRCDRKELLARPMVDQRLKNRKVTDVLFRHYLRQIFQFFWSVSAFLGLIAELLADCPVERVALRAFGEVDVAETEETVGFFLFLLSVVVTL